MSEFDKNYIEFLNDLKSKILTSRYQTVRIVNTELILLYWEIGQALLQRQKSEGWGSQVIQRLAHDLNKNFPEMKGFSYRNLKYMRQFALEWSTQSIRQQAVAQLPWGHNIVLLQKITNNPDRLWYAQQPCTSLSLTLLIIF
ncbi:MAG: hypothetical protein KBD63_05810 [Bacteriovoracaceae bacterium]|nr:hypothetical protein [Bacteriovoracaceae bacterium]